MKLLLKAVLLLLLSASVSSACTLSWNAVTTATDGSKVTGVKYKVYFMAAGTQSEQVIVDTPEITVTILCPAGHYAVTAYSAEAAESGKSNIILLKETTKPNNLLWTK